MTFRSILSKETEFGVASEKSEPPGFFPDLNLDQIIAKLTLGREEYDLAPIFYKSLGNSDAILFRQEIMRDLENVEFLDKINHFANTLRSMRAILKRVGKHSYKYQREALFLDAVGVYCDAVNFIECAASHANLRSQGLLSFREYLTAYVNSDRFLALQAKSEKLKAELSTVKYTLLIRGGRITVRKYESEVDYTADVEQTFHRFQQGAAKDYRIKFSEWSQMNHIEAAILERVALLYSDIFTSLDYFCKGNADYLDETVGAFDREIQFYVAYLEYIAPLRAAGLSFCYPSVSDRTRDLRAREVYDLALANKLLADGATVVCNDFEINSRERIFIVSGPNQGGKTTFARMFGQLHYLASLGCLVPGTTAQLSLFDNIFTHFEKEENIHTLRGKLQDDLVRIHEILNQATSNSIIILNEIFNSTPLKDAIFLGTTIIERILAIDALCVCVTFIDELTLLSDRVVSIASTIEPDHPATRTYRIVRKPADGLAYAMSIAEKYRLTRRQIRERIKS
jgi:DNA mismatch repair protein MutS